MKRKAKLIVGKKWKMVMLQWSIFPVSALIYIALNRMGLLHKNSPLHPLVDSFYTEWILKPESANAYMVLVPFIFFIFWLLHSVYALKRQQRVYLRNIFEFLLKPITSFLNIGSGLFISGILLTLFSDINVFEVGPAVVFISVAALGASAVFTFVARDFFNLAITNKHT